MSARFVIPADAGIQVELAANARDPRFRAEDGCGRAGE